MYYADPQRVEHLRRLAAHWDGTRYASGPRAVCGMRGGAGCISYTIAIHTATGAIQGLDPSALPAYADDWSAHNHRSLLDEWLIDHGYLSPGLKDGDLANVITDPARLLPGDVCAFSPGRCTHHLATMITAQRLTHSLKPIGVAQHMLFERVSAARRHRRMVDWFAYAIRIK